MDNTNVNERIQFLEGELKGLKESISAPDTTSRVGFVLRSANRFIATYQPLLTVMTAIATLIFLQMNFGYGTWASYRSAANAKDANKNIAEFYRQLGDRLVSDAQYDEAADTYKSALALQPNNVQAIHGLTKAQIFKVPEGRKYNDVQLVRLKLNYLTSFGDDADVEFFKCQTFLDRDDAQAETFCTKAIELNPRMYVANVDLGYLCIKKKDFECAKQNFQKALEINADSAEANANLGICELLELKAEDARTHLEKSLKLKDDVETMLALGDAYRYSKDIDSAIGLHKAGLDTSEEKDIELESVAHGEWLINAMPMREDDTETKAGYYIVSDIKIKRAFFEYALAIDYALQGDFASAQRELEKAKQKDPDKSFGDYFVNRGGSAANILKVDAKTKSWLEQKSRQVCSKKVCPVINALFR